MRLLALLAIVAIPSAVLSQDGSIPDPGGQAFRWSTGASVLLPLADTGGLAAGRIPSGRLTLSTQLNPTFGVHFGGLRLAPTDYGLWAGVAGVRLNLLKGRARLSVFTEGGAGRYSAVVDSGGFDVVGPDGETEYRSFRRPAAGLSFGGGGGAGMELILGPGITFELLGGYWHFTGGGVTVSQPFAGGGMRLAVRDEPWYWRTSGQDRRPPIIAVVDTEKDAEGRADVGVGELRVLVYDESELEDVVIGGRSVPLIPSPEPVPYGQGRVAVVSSRDLSLQPGENTVLVTSRDRAGNEARQELIVLGPPADESPPRIAVVSPETGTPVVERVATVAGLIVDGSPLSAVLVAGVAATTREAAPDERTGISAAAHERVYRFEAQVPVVAGEHVLRLEAADTAGNQAILDHVVIRPDNEAPVIAELFPAMDAEVNASLVRLSGWVVDEGNIASVEVNGAPAKLELDAAAPTEGAERGLGVSAEGQQGGAAEAAAGVAAHTLELAPGQRAVRFEADVSLVQGRNAVVVTARDASGNEGVLQHRLLRSAVVAGLPGSGPIIRIDEPREWATAGATSRGFAVEARNSVRIRGTVRDPNGSAIREVRINGSVAAAQVDAAGTVRFTGFAPISERTREVEIAAWTSDGRHGAHVVPIRPAVSDTRAAEPERDFEDGSRGQRYAVVVGISDYADDAIPDLQFADDDALAFYEFLRSPAAGMGGIPEENIRLLLNEGATYRELRSALYTFLEAATSEDIVYIYIAGHGAPNPRRPDDLYLLAYDTEAEDIPGTGFPMSDVNEAIRRLYAHHTVLLTDACHSGGVGMGAGTRAIGGAAAMNGINQSFLMDLHSTQSGLAIFTASEARQLSQEDVRWGGGHGAFTYYLLEGLRGAADGDNDRIVRWGEVTEYVRSMVSRDTRNAQIPSLGSSTHDRYLPMAIVLEEYR